MEEYDVIIAGASFAGLAVASRITKGKVLLIDRNDIGTHQISACGTTIKMVEDVRCEKSILKKFDIIAVHTKNKEVNFHIPKFCTIDYKKFCDLLSKQNTAKFVKANIKEIDGSLILTDKGKFKSKLIVDCTGQAAVLAVSAKKGFRNKNMISFGIETEIPYVDDKLRFFVNPELIKNGAGWIFPCKKTARFGVGAYGGNTKILLNLKKMVESHGLEVGEIHGGFFCYCPREPIVNKMFVVGCAAGQTLPLTGEGIRRSVYFGLKCGNIIQKIVNNKLSLEEGLGEYKKEALKGRKRYNVLIRAQNMLPAVPNWALNIILSILAIKPIANFLWKKYEEI